MCTKSYAVSPLPIKLAKFTVIVIFFCFAECAAGSCLSYGHACWGAHGKRNNIPVRESSPANRDSAWFLSRLVPLSYATDRDLKVPPNQQLYADAPIEAEPFKGPEDFRNDIYSNEDNALFEEIYNNQRPRFHKIKPSKSLDKRSAKMI